MSEAFNLTDELVAALKALHKLGWVHRDISSGNLMVQEQQLKIADFEYAKKMTKPGPDRIHDIRTVSINGAHIRCSY